MSQSFVTEIDLSPDISHLVTEDDAPMDNFPSEKQQRLLTESLYSSWSPGIPFLAAANVGLFYAISQPPVVPDVLLSLDVSLAEDWWQKQHRSYFFWEFGKLPEVVIEIVSNRQGNELRSKLDDYARMRVSYYVVFDPIQQLSTSVLQVYQLQATSYVAMTDNWLKAVGLGLKLWEGEFEGKQSTWLRWCNQTGDIIPTGAERAEQEHQRAEQERQRAEQERQRAEQEHQRAEQAESFLEQERRRADQLAAQLRALGIEPDQPRQG